MVTGHAPNLEEFGFKVGPSFFFLALKPSTFNSNRNQRLKLSLAKMPSLDWRLETEVYTQ